MNLWQPKPSIPAEPPRLLPGPTAWYWQRQATIALFAGAAAVVIGLLVGSNAPPPVNAFLVFGGVLAALVLAVRGFRANVRGYQAIHREQQAGYTTLFGREFRPLWHLDPKTGAVIRRPGETE